MTGRRACIDCSFCLFCNTILCFTLVFSIVWFIFLPQEPKFSITNASLTNFDFIGTTRTLHYNLELNITIRNPKKVDIYYNSIQVIAKYKKKEFAMLTVDSTPFYQGHKNTTILDHVVLEGQQSVEFGEPEVSKFKAETAAGFYSIDVQLVLQVKLGYDMFKTRYYQQSGGKIDCKLKVPLRHARRFKTTKCGNVYIISDPVF
ncbi:putative Late embryogenesis abundant protein, LEA-14 [Rosa chinensis]|uniref:Putative Late embryogenesis abundant protein, LEA-14 n=1 Tax=Rosa chinensis TaxID=74649 RepID=A0A2P6RBU2_ROSCH|nr:NDR1/HIN1-like protein 10 [Rosa chinensis]PRQ43880.1 putative Late embryogenesis abundant protein, LEA-14 [Rosa chinensis]